MAFAASAAIRAAARTPSISFPVRRMPDGTRVSDLPVAEASAFLQSVAGAGSGGGEAGKSFTMSRPRPPPIPFPRPGPPRRALSEEEMEAVMLGGATD